MKSLISSCAFAALRTTSAEPYTVSIRVCRGIFCIAKTVHTCSQRTGLLTNGSRACNPSRVAKLMAAMHILLLPSSPRYVFFRMPAHLSLSSGGHVLPYPISIKKPQYPSSGSKSGTGVWVVPNWTRLEATWAPSQQPSSRLRGDS